MTIIIAEGINLDSEIRNILNRIENNKKILGICGNGGSLAEAQHFAGELIPIGIPCIAFNDGSALTAIANDVAYQGVFCFYINAFKHQLDTVFLLTTSGKSQNIITAIDFLKTEDILDNHIHRIAITTTGNEKILHLGSCHECLVILFDGDTQRVQEKTLEFIHQFYRLAKEK